MGKVSPLSSTGGTTTDPLIPVSASESHVNRSPSSWSSQLWYGGEADDGNGKKNCFCRYTRTILAIIGVVGIGVGFLFLCRLYLGPILEWHRNLNGVVNVVVYVALFMIVSFPFLFGYVVLCVGSGYIYGLWWGLSVSVGGSLWGGFVGFMCCRYACKGCTRRSLRGVRNYDVLRALIEGNHKIRIMSIIRLSPVPYGFQNALFAFTDVHVGWVLLATLALVPTQIVFCYIGTTLPSSDDIVNGKFDPVVVGIEIVISCLITGYIAYRMKTELDKRTEEYKQSHSAMVLEYNDDGTPPTKNAAFQLSTANDRSISAPNFHVKLDLSDRYDAIDA
eukprot:m.180605 g.180605  ORF g.180605 m.180605 type:complete len:334 (+) comp18425_c0_seq1:394-1395(+)